VKVRRRHRDNVGRNFPAGLPFCRWKDFPAGLPPGSRPPGQPPRFPTDPVTSLRAAGRLCTGREARKLASVADVSCRPVLAAVSWSHGRAEAIREAGPLGPYVRS
jgi:hypothetical protein